MHKSSNLSFLERTVQVATQIHDQDKTSVERLDRIQQQRNFCKLDLLVERTVDTRAIKQDHVDTLIESIAALGLIEPIVIDKKNILLAGGHRLAAIKQLKKQSPEVYDRHFPNNCIPVHIMGFDSKVDVEQALKVEVAENEQRKDYTPAEVRAIADRLRAVGYEDVKGRPRADQKPLIPALSIVIGKNKRTVQRYLAPAESNKSKSATRDALLLKKAVKNLKSWQKLSHNHRGAMALEKQLPFVLELLQNAIVEKCDT